MITKFDHRHKWRPYTKSSNLHRIKCILTLAYARRFARVNVRFVNQIYPIGTIQFFKNVAYVGTIPDYSMWQILTRSFQLFWSDEITNIHSNFREFAIPLIWINTKMDQNCYVLQLKIMRFIIKILRNWKSGYETIKIYFHKNVIK